MVLSLAFILALVGSAIVLVIGIVIFGEIADAMELTLPTQGTVLLPLQAISQGNLTANNEWQLREQPVDGVTLIDCKYGIRVGGGLTNFPNPPAPSTSSRGFCHVFKVFDKADITGKVLSVTWSTNRGGDPSGTLGAICVLDGIFDRNNATQFPPNNNSVGACGGNTAVRLHLVNPSSQFGTQTDTITLLVSPLITPDPNKDQVTIFVMVKDPSGSRRYSMDIKEISVLELANWDWKLGATVTMATTTTNNDTGITNAPLTNLLPLILSESDQQQVDTFNNAQVIGFTVIGILPIALFFALFSIFSGRIE